MCKCLLAELLSFHFVLRDFYSHDVSGPSRSALKAMLVNLDNDMDAPALQSGLHSPPHHSDVSSFGDEGNYLFLRTKLDRM